MLGVLNLSWFFDEAVNVWFQNNVPKILFQIITFLGDGLAYIIILAIAFWIMKKKDAIIAIYVLLTASFLNFFLKVVIKKPRPDVSYRLIEAEGFSTPSGHAQTSTTVYGWIMLYFKKIWLYVITPIVVLLICLSRVVLGVHYLGDVIIGFLVGAALLTALYFGIPYLIKWMDNWPDWVKILVGEAYGLVVFIVTFIPGLYANWPSYEDMNNSADIVSALMLFPLFIWIEHKWIKMDNENLAIESIILRAFVGLILVVGAYFGLDLLFDQIILPEIISMKI